VAQPIVDLTCSVKVTSDLAGNNPVNLNNAPAEVYVHFVAKNTKPGEANTFLVDRKVSEYSDGVHTRFHGAWSISLKGNDSQHFVSSKIALKPNVKYEAVIEVDKPDAQSGRTGRIKETNETNNICKVVFTGPYLG